MPCCGLYNVSLGGAATSLALKENGYRKKNISQVLMVVLGDVVPKPLPTPVVDTRVEDFNFVAVHG